MNMSTNLKGYFLISILNVFNGEVKDNDAEVVKNLDEVMIGQYEWENNRVFREAYEKAYWKLKRRDQGIS